MPEAAFGTASEAVPEAALILDRIHVSVYIVNPYGGMAEWLKAAVLKTADGETRPGVQIPLPPPAHDPAMSGKYTKP